MLNEYPTGLHARTECFRCCSTTWNAECKEFILARMRHSTGNIKPVCVIEADESVTMYITSKGLTDLIETTPVGDQIIMIRRQESIAHWMKQRTKVQKTHNIKPTAIFTVDDVKERICDLLEKQDYRHELLTGPEKAELSKEMAKV